MITGARKKQCLLSINQVSIQSGNKIVFFILILFNRLYYIRAYNKPYHMNKLFTLLFLGLSVFSAKAQTPAPLPTAQAFGKIDKADLEMKACSFEKDANAEVLFDKGEVYFDQSYNIVTEKHKR